MTTAAENGRIGRGGRAQKIVYAAERKEANPTRRKQMNALAEAMYKTWICRHVDAARLLYTAGVRNPVVAASRSEAHNHGNPKPIKMLALLTEPIGLTPEQYDMAQKLMV